ncbi:class I SAM-dependent methyltransferase [Patescibacteria group bacterium]
MMKRRVKLAVNNPVWDQVVRRMLMRNMWQRLATDERLSVLEVGCGRGGTTELLLDIMPNAFITATDVDDEQVLQAERRISCPRVEFLVEHAAEMSFDDESFDAVAAFNTYHHVPNWTRAVAEAARVLKPGGRLYVTGITSRGLKFAPFRDFVSPKSLIDPERLKAAAADRGLKTEHELGNDLYMRLVLRKVKADCSPLNVDTRRLIR